MKRPVLFEKNQNKENLLRESFKSNHSVLNDKGDYLFFEKNELFLMEKNKPHKVRFISLSIDLEYDFRTRKNTYYLISFNLKQKNLNHKTGYKIYSLLTKLKSNNIKFRVSRALPKFIFSREQLHIFDEFSIPASCKYCLELYKIKEDWQTILCNNNRLKFRFTKNGRIQVYEYLKELFGIDTIKTPLGEVQLISKLNCFSQQRQVTDELIHIGFEIYWVTKVGWSPSSEIINGVKNYGNILQNGIILDNGGAHGKDSFYLHKKKFKVILCEIKKGFFRYTKQKQNDANIYFPMLNADGRKLPFKDNVFSGVFSGGVMHHRMNLAGINAYIAESYRVLKPGGVFFGNVCSNWTINTPKGHFIFNDLTELITLLEKPGFIVLEDIYEESLHDADKRTRIFVCQKPHK